MGQTDELERLAALHQSGALSDEEFASAKARLLGRRIHYLAAAGAFGVVLALIAVLLVVQVGMRPAGSLLAIGNSAVVSANQSGPKSAPVSGGSSGQVPTSLLQNVFRREMLNAQISYLEHMIGPARNVDGAVRTYIVDGCKVTVGTSGSAIATLGLPSLSPNCTVSLADFGIDGPTAYKMTFANFEDMSIETTFSADCLSSCGNAYDPSVYALVQTPHADDYLTFRPGVVLVDDNAVDVSEKWAGAMRKAEGEDYVVRTRFNCDRKFDELAASLFRNVHITSIVVSHTQEPVAC
jgi:hypothetical protein